MRSYLGAIGLTLAFAVFTCVASADDIAVGSRVQFERAGKTFEGKVVSVRGNGLLYEIESTVDGQTRKLVIAAKSVKALPSSNADAWRTWSDSSGKFKLEARMHSQNAFEITLQKRDGKLVKVPLDKLSIADQEYVSLAESNSENPFAGGTAGPMAGAGSSSTGGTSSSSGSASSGLSLPEPIVLQVPSAMQSHGGGIPLDFKPDPTRLDFSKLDTASMNIPKMEGDVGKSLFVDAAGTRLSYQVRSGNSFGRNAGEPFTKIFLVDGESRRTKVVGEINGHSIWLCSGDPESGNVLGAVMQRGNDNSSSLCVISGIPEGKPQVIAHWRLYPNNDKAAFYISYRKILSNGIAIVYYDGKIHAFDYENNTNAWNQPSGSFNEPAVSPGGRYTACNVDRGILILETKTGDHLGVIPTTLNGPVSMGLSPDGKQLAVAAGNKVVVYDPTSAEVTYQHVANVALGAMGKQFFWAREQTLLLPTGLVLDMQQDTVFWRYDLMDDGIDYTDVEHQGLLAFKRNDRLTIVRLPHARAKQAAANTPPNLVALRT